MVHGTPTYYQVVAKDLNIIANPASVQAYLDALTAKVEPKDTAPPMHGTQDSIYPPTNPGNPAVRP
jgi:hypothetical protein